MQKCTLLLALSAQYAEQRLCICRASVLSVPAWATAAKSAAVAWPAGDIDRLLQQRRTNADSDTLSAYVLSIAEHKFVS